MSGAPRPSPFHILPAIDLRGGRVVRLEQGDPARETAYSGDPGTVSGRWVSAGARWLHVVNLDGAFGQASPENRKALEAILAETARLNPACRLQFGGGLRSLDDIEAALDLGVNRVVLGTAAVETPLLVKQVVQRWGPDSLAVGIDARAGRVQVRGWTRSSRRDPVDLALEMSGYGLKTIIYTDIARDGMGTGPDLETAVQIARETGLGVIASGGVSRLDDLRRARDAGLLGIVVGRALYDGRIQIEEALQC